MGVEIYNANGMVVGVGHIEHVMMCCDTRRFVELCGKKIAILMAFF